MPETQHVCTLAESIHSRQLSRRGAVTDARRVFSDLSSGQHVGRRSFLKRLVLKCSWKIWFHFHQDNFFLHSSFCLVWRRSSCTGPSLLNVLCLILYKRWEIIWTTSTEGCKKLVWLFFLIKNYLNVGSKYIFFTQGLICVFQIFFCTLPLTF